MGARRDWIAHCRRAALRINSGGAEIEVHPTMRTVIHADGAFAEYQDLD
jgi:hypothetical protein